MRSSAQRGIIPVHIEGSASVSKARSLNVRVLPQVTWRHLSSRAFLWGHRVRCASTSFLPTSSGSCMQSLNANRSLNWFSSSLDVFMGSSDTTTEVAREWGTDWERSVIVDIVVAMVYSPSHVWLCHAMDCSPAGSSVHGISQARTQEWVAISFSRESSQPRDQTQVSCTGRLILYHWVARKAQEKMFMAIFNPEQSPSQLTSRSLRTHYKEFQALGNARHHLAKRK